jgi:hypothetical protein
MSVKSTVLFDKPQSEIASLIAQRISQSTATSIVTGFATPGGVDAIAAPIGANPGCLASLIVGAATYPGFQALDKLIAVGVPKDRLYVHLGHTRPSGTYKNPTVRFHPMLHSKVYYMELPQGEACAFIGSHNVTSFALTGLNGEAAVLLEGPASSVEFEAVRKHIEAVRIQSALYTPEMKEALAWWTRESIEGLRAEVGIPQDAITVRTILVFAVAARGVRPVPGDQIYFEIPAGIEQIESLKTETHLFLFESLPPNPWEALDRAMEAHTRLTCMTLGAENKQGNLEVVANWRIDGMTTPVLRPVPEGIFRPNTASGMQQVRAEVESPSIVPFEYLFNREKSEWDPEYSTEPSLHPRDIGAPIALKEALGGRNPREGWRLVKKLVPRPGSGLEKDHAALELVKPESGSFLLVSLRRRKKDLDRRKKEDS